MTQPETHRFNLPRINLNDPYSRSNQLSPQRIRKSSNCRLRRTINASSGIWLPPGYAPNINNISCTTILPLLVDLQDLLSHMDQPSHIRLEHNIKIILSYFGGSCNAFDKPSARNQHGSIQSERKTLTRCSQGYQCP